MSIQQQREVIPELDDEAVAGFLRQNPDFFQRQQELLAELYIPHECGSALSLLEYQARVLREANRNLRTKLEELLAVARDNDRVAERMHRLTLELIRAESLDSILFSLKDSLRSDFRADFVAVRLLVPAQHANAPDLVASGLPELDLFKPTLEEQRPICGMLTQPQLRFLFGDSAHSVGSVALVPIVDHTTLGMLAIGSRQADRFHAGMGTVFLRQLGALLGRAVYGRLPRE